MMYGKTLVALSVAAALLGGCVSLAPEQAVSGVLDEAVERAELNQDGPASLVSPSTVINLALTHNRSVRADLLQAGISAAELNARSRPSNPIFEVVSLPGGDHGRVFDVDLRASVLGVAATPWRTREARANYEAQRSDALLRLIDFTAEVERAWVEAVAAKLRLDLYARIVDASEAAMTVAQELDAAGNRPPIALVRERNMQINVQLEQAAARLQAETARFTLERLVGRPVSLEDLPQTLPDLPLSNGLGPDAALQVSLPLARSRAQVEAASRSAGLENWASLLDHAELGLAAEREDRQWARGWMAEIALPIFDQGQHRRTVARLRAEQALERHAALTADITAAVGSASWVLDLAREQARDVDMILLPSSQEMLDQTMLHYNAMQLGVFDLLTAFEIRTRAGLAWVDAQVAAHRADIALRQLAAGGSPSEVSLMPVSAGASAEAGGH